jgi:tRNA/rRNA methyltransferase
VQGLRHAAAIVIEERAPRIRGRVETDAARVFMRKPQSVASPGPGDGAPDAGAARTRFVLVRPSHAGNVGAAARAMRVMGFGDLMIVAPSEAGVLAHPDALALASGATDVLQSARIVPDLSTAVGDAQMVIATAMTPRDFGPPVRSCRELTRQVAASDARVAFVFGPERLGLSNDEVYRCDAVLSIPTDPAYGSLNLAQAVQVVAYEWRQALGGFEVVDRRRPARRADSASVDGLLGHWQQVLVRLGYLDPGTPRKLMARLAGLLRRAEVRDDEVHILRGIARAVDDAIDESRAAPPRSGAG